MSFLEIRGCSMRTQGVAVVVLALLIFSDRALPVVGWINDSTSFSFPDFRSDGTPTRILMSGNAFLNTSTYSYDMTTTVGNQLQNCGNIMYYEKIHMADSASNKSASFNTSFTFSFDSNSSQTGGCGDGMAFSFFSGPGLSAQEMNLNGYGMCVYNSSDISSSNNVFAVTFDSHGNGVGVVVINKGVLRQTYVPLCPKCTDCDFPTPGDPVDPGYNLKIKFCTHLCGAQNEFSAWIDYDSVNQTVEFRFASGNFSRGKPEAPGISVPDVALHEILGELMYVGFSASTDYSGLNYSTESHRVSAWNFYSSLSVDPSPPSPSPLPALIGGISGAIVGAALVGILFFCCFKHRNKLRSLASETKPPEPVPANTGLKITDTHARAYTYKELSTITKSFGASELLSSGAFGDVYKGTPPGPGRNKLLAVKRIKENKARGHATFLAEVNSLSQIRHRHLLQLRGWCEAKEGMFLVYDFMSNGSLDMWLHPLDHPTSDQTVPELPWDVRRLVLAGVASGLEYLHEGWVQCVLHRDIKSSNVMLDADFNAYLGDFGLARLVDHAKLQKTTLVAGTLGYMAPEMHYTGRASKETDVYAFGTLVLEVVCGRRPFTTPQEGDEGGGFLLLERVWRAREAGDIAGMIDPKMLHPSDPGSNQNTAEGVIESPAGLQAMTNVLQVGLLCCLPNPSERPSMRLVTNLLQASELGPMEFPSLPATTPCLPGQYVSVPAQPPDGTWRAGSVSSDSFSQASSDPSSTRSASPKATHV